MQVLLLSERNIISTGSRDLSQNRTITDVYSAISTLPISNTLDESLASVYRQQLIYGLHLPIDIYPEARFCSNGFALNSCKLERKASLFTWIMIFMILNTIKVIYLLIKQIFRLLFIQSNTLFLYVLQSAAFIT